jgi:hypothetical protein
MIIFQLDKCTNSKKLWKLCNEQSLCQVERLPRDLLDENDDRILKLSLDGNRPLVTVDHTIHYDNTQSMTQRHPGIVIIHSAKRATLVEAEILDILAKFKSSFPSWHITPMHNSVIQITQLDINVWHKADSGLIHDAYIERSTEGWQDQLAAFLSKNAALCS